jgi:hypothetical protein
MRRRKTSPALRWWQTAGLVLVVTGVCGFAEAVGLIGKLIGGRL